MIKTTSQLEKYTAVSGSWVPSSAGYTLHCDKQNQYDTITDRINNAQSATESI
jgi:hypothetical protein